MPKSKPLLFLCVLVISFVLMTYQSRKGRILSGNPAGSLLNNSQAVATSLTDTLTGPFRKMALRDEDNRRLKKRISDLLLEREKYQGALLENKRLRELLKLRETEKKSVAAARVIGRGVDHWTHTMLIDKGRKDGVEKDLTAVTPRGLAGKVIDAAGSYSHILLLTDINFSVAVRLQEKRMEGILSGTGTSKCVLRYIPFEEEVKPGDVVITSGLDGLFPVGVPVGYVSYVDNKTGGGHFQYIEVIPYQDESRLEEVLIVGR